MECDSTSFSHHFCWKEACHCTTTSIPQYVHDDLVKHGKDININCETCLPEFGASFIQLWVHIGKPVPWFNTILRDQIKNLYYYVLDCMVACNCTFPESHLLYQSCENCFVYIFERCTSFFENYDLPDDYAIEVSRFYRSVNTQFALCNKGCRLRSNITLHLP